MCLTETDRPTDREGWMSVGVGASINTESMEAHGLSDPNVNFRGGCTGHRRGQRSAFMLMTNNAQLCPEHREKTVTTRCSHEPACTSQTILLFFELLCILCCIFISVVLVSNPARTDYDIRCI